MAAQEIREYLTELRKIEDKFYRTVLNDPDTYMLAIRLVRAIADSLKSISDLPALIGRYQRTSSDDVIPIADALDTPQVILLDYQLALGAAFYLRAQEIQEEIGRTAMQSHVAAAQAQGQSWVVVFDYEQTRYSKPFSRRLEMRVADGFSLYSSSELDMDKGLVYTVEPMWIDLVTGKQRQDLALNEPRQEFATHAAMLEAAAALRRKYS
jgi:hypothetical protein